MYDSFPAGTISAFSLLSSSEVAWFPRVMPASRHHPGPGGVGGLRQDVPLQRAAQLQLPPEREQRLQRRVAAVQVEPVQGGVALRGPGHPPRRDVRADLLQRGVWSQEIQNME